MDSSDNYEQSSNVSEGIYKKMFRETDAQFADALNLDNGFQYAEALGVYKTLSIKAKSAYETTDLNDKKRLREIIEISERREKEISRYMEVVKDIKGRLSSAESVSKWLRKNIHYKGDRIVSDYWQPPDETMSLKTGDCEDFAILAQSFLGEIGVQSEIVFIGLKEKFDRSAHAICVFQENGLYGYFSGPNIHQPFAFSLQQLVEKEYPNWLSIKTVNFPTRTETIITRR